MHIHTYMPIYVYIYLYIFRIFFIYICDINRISMCGDYYYYCMWLFTSGVIVLSTIAIIPAVYLTPRTLPYLSPRSKNLLTVNR